MISELDLKNNYTYDINKKIIYNKGDIKMKKLFILNRKENIGDICNLIINKKSKDCNNIIT